MEENFICKFCGREFKVNYALTYHQNRCKNNPNRIINTPTYIEHHKKQCQYCGKEFDVACLKRHEDACGNPNSKLNKNKSKIIDYNTDLTCRYCGKQYKDAGNLVQHEKYVCQLNSNITEEDRQNRKIKYQQSYINKSDDAKQAMTWNKGLTADIDPRVAKYSALMKTKYATGELHGSWLGRHHTEDQKLKISKAVSVARKEGYSNGTIVPAKGVGRGKYSYITFENKTYMLRSTYEFIYALYLISQGIKFEVENIRVKAAYENQYANTFISDFNIGNLIVEIKGIKSEKDKVIKDSFEAAGYEFKELFFEDINLIKEQLKEKFPIDELINEVIEGHNSKNYFNYYVK